MDVQYQRGMLETEGVCLSQPITCSWSKVAILHDSIVVRTHPQAIPPAMITMGKSIHGFPFLSRMGMGPISFTKREISSTGSYGQGQTWKQDRFGNEENLSNAALHKLLLRTNSKYPAMKTKSIHKLWSGVPSEIHKLYNWPFSITKNTKLIVFQFKINHSIIYTKGKLKRANIISDDLCHLCKSEQHTIKHVF